MADKKVVPLSDYVKRLPSPAEGLRLIKAFADIAEPKRRAEILAMVEKIAAQSRDARKRPKK